MGSRGREGGFGECGWGVEFLRLWIRKGAGSE